MLAEQHTQQFHPSIASSNAGLTLHPTAPLVLVARLLIDPNIQHVLPACTAEGEGCKALPGGSITKRIHVPV